MEMMLDKNISKPDSWTNCKSFDVNGFFIIKNVWNPDDLYDEIPEKSGLYKYDSKRNVLCKESEEFQVEGSTSRYNHPKYRYAHSQIRKEIEKVIGRKLYNTYYYDRFYSPGQQLEQHVDRNACEISISVHVGTNIKEDWPFFIKSPDILTPDSKLNIGKVHGVVLGPGDGVVYKGCQCPHWRHPMPGKNFVNRFKKEKLYYHQIFFHYVLSDGIRSHYAFDMLNNLDNGDPI